MFAVNRNKQLLSCSLQVAGAVLLAALAVTSAVTSAQADTVRACLVRTTDTSRWSPPSPDPAGITLLPNGHLLISDSEVEEPPAPYFHGVNLYEALTSGTLLATASTLAFSQEPTGVTVNPSNGHLFFSDDDRKKIFEVNLGTNRLYDSGTPDDSVTSFSTTALNPTAGVDPEGVAFGLGDLFVAGGGGGVPEVYQIDPGPNGIFNGVPPTGDDEVVHSFGTISLGVLDPEGIAFNSDHNSLYIIGRDGHLVETTTTGALLQTIDITSLHIVAPSDVVYAPGSLNPLIKHLYITARGVDNNVDPLENDGKMYEITVNSLECILPPL